MFLITLKNIAHYYYNGSFFTKFLVNFCDKIRRAHTGLARSKMFSVSLEKDFIFRFHTHTHMCLCMCVWKRNMKSFSNETLNIFFRKLCFSYILDLAKPVWALRILSQKFTKNFVKKELWALENHVLVNMLLCSSHFTEIH